MEASVSGEEYSHFFQVQTDLFSGPIDLLLHLVKQNELPIEKISLAQVTNQYLTCIERMRQFDLDIAGEYLVIAATLISVKSSVLLNEPVELVEDEEGNLVNPHDELLRRLREAEVYRQGVDLLGKRNLLGIDVFESPGTLSGIDAPPVKYRPHDSILLGLAFKKMLEKAGKENLYTIQVESVSVMERMMGIVNRLQSHGGALRFTELLSDVNNRMQLIGSFVALLELCKRQVIAVSQENFDSDIVIALSDGTGTVEIASSEFDAEPDKDENVAAGG